MNPYAKKLLQEKNQHMKNKWLAATLNILPGVGYLYLGVRTPFAVILLLIIPAAMIAGSLDPTMNSSSDSNSSLSWGVLLILGIPALAFIVDAYNEAGRLNSEKKIKPKRINSEAPKEDKPTTSESSRQASASKQKHDFFEVSPAKVALMSITTLSLYNIYWMYKQWSVVKSEQGSDIMPFWRAVFGIFFIASLFKNMGIKNYVTLAVAYIALQFSAKLPGALWVMTILSFTPLMVAQAQINNRSRSTNIQASYSDKELALMGVGTIMLSLALIGTLSMIRTP